MSIQDRVASYLNIPPNSKQSITITDEKLCEIAASVATLEREAASDHYELAIQKAIKLITDSDDPPNECIAALGFLIRALPLEKQPDLGD